MKREIDLWNGIWEWKNLEHAFAKAITGKRSRLDARTFTERMPASLARIGERPETDQLYAVRCSGN